MIPKLSHLPNRSKKPRTNGITMVMDKGLSIREAENLCSVASHLVDYIKLGFGTSMVSNGVAEKIKIYHQSNIKVYLGGTLFEAFLIRNQLDDYKKLISNWQLDTIEISDGSMIIDHQKKCELIQEFCINYHVLSEVGSKDEAVIYDNAVWISQMQKELEAGSSFVIAEARESGTVGIFNNNHQSNTSLVNQLSENIPIDKILWEAPIKKQQIDFIKQFGCNVNLGNVNPSEIVALETLRLGLRGDTFFDYLPSSFQDLKQ